MEDVWFEHLRSRVQLWLQSDRHFPKLNVMPFPPIDKDKFQKDDYCVRHGYQYVFFFKHNFELKFPLFAGNLAIH